LLNKLLGAFSLRVLGLLSHLGMLTEPWKIPSVGTTSTRSIIDETAHWYLNLPCVISKHSS